MMQNPHREDDGSVEWKISKGLLAFEDETNIKNIIIRSKRIMYEGVGDKHLLME